MIISNYNIPIINTFFFFIGFLFILCSSWFKDIINEEYSLGLNTEKEISMKHLGINMFLFSEVMLFFSFFFVFSFLVLKPNSAFAFSMPFPDIHYPNPFGTVLLNTIILLISGYAITFITSLFIRKKINKKRKYFFINMYFFRM